MENFIVSARKYRPANFLSVVGQNHITNTLKNAISRNHLAHAYLFCGPRGVGKTTCARIFAKAINCLNPTDSEACNQCESCKGFNEGRSFNIHELDAASNNSVDDIRSLTDQVRIPPQIGRYSVYIIDEVHMLSSQAFNAFLKTLEEPPAHAIFILATTEKHKIIPTILSRCQIFDFNRIRVEDGVSYLKYIAGEENVTSDEESLHLIAQKADGGMRDALSMFDKAVSFCGNNLNFKEVAKTLNVLDYDTYFTVTDDLRSGNYQNALTMFDEILRSGFSGQIFIAGLNAHFRDLLMCKNPQTLSLLEITGTLLERYKQQAEQCDVGFLFDAISLLTALDGTLRTSSNQRLSVELGLMKLSGLGQKKNNAIGNDRLASVKDFPLPDLNATKAASNAAPSAVPGTQQAAPADTKPATASQSQPTSTPQVTAQENSAAEQQTAQAREAHHAGAVQPVSTPEQQNAPATEPAGMTAKQPAPVVAKSEVPQTRQFADAAIQSPAPSVAAPKQDAEAAQPEMIAPEMPVAVEEATSAQDQTADRPAQVQSQAETTVPQAAQTPLQPLAPEPSASPKPQMSAEPAQSSPQPSHTARRGASGISISGASISSIMNYSIADAGKREEDTGEVHVDPLSEVKIGEHKDEFMTKLNASRPRFAMAFHSMEVAGNTISVSVANESLHDELMRNKTEVLTLLAETAGVDGVLDLKITILADTRGLKPIKVEDKIRFLTEKNPLLTVLRKEIDLDVE